MRPGVSVFRDGYKALSGEARKRHRRFGSVQGCVIAAPCEGAKLEWRQVWKRWAAACRVLLKRRYRWTRWDLGATNVGGRLLGRLTTRERHVCELSQLGLIARGKAAPSLDTPGAVQETDRLATGVCIRHSHQSISMTLSEKAGYAQTLLPSSYPGGTFLTVSHATQTALLAMSGVLFFPGGAKVRKVRLPKPVPLVTQTCVFLDHREKEEFEARLRARDESRTKKLAPEEQLSAAEKKEQQKRK